MNRQRISTIAQIAAWCLLGFIHSADGEEARYLRVGTGPPGENHFSLGSLIASAISAPPGLPCNHNGGCGVAGLIAVASATAGSEANLETLADGRLDAALVEADTPVPAGHKPDQIRAVANLSLDQMQLVVLKDGPIHALRDLKGKRISLGEQGSGTHLHAHQLLAAMGFKDSDVKEDNLRSALAADAMLAGKLDAFFVMDEAPVPTIAELAKIKPIRLIGVTGPAVEKMRAGDLLLEPSRIPAGTYTGIETDTPTIAVGLTFVVSAKLSEDLVYGITKSFWQPETQQVLNEARRGGMPITAAGAVTGLGVSLHPGAQRYYNETKPVLR